MVPLQYPDRPTTSANKFPIVYARATRTRGRRPRKSAAATAVIMEQVPLSLSVHKSKGLFTQNIEIGCFNFGISKDFPLIFYDKLGPFIGDNWSMALLQQPIDLSKLTDNTDDAARRQLEQMDTTIDNVASRKNDPPLPAYCLKAAMGRGTSEFSELHFWLLQFKFVFSCHIRSFFLWACWIFYSLAFVNCSKQKPRSAWNKSNCRETPSCHLFVHVSETRGKQGAHKQGAQKGAC